MGIDQVINTLVPDRILKQANSELVVEIKSKVLHPYAFRDLIVANKNSSPIF